MDDRPQEQTDQQPSAEQKAVSDLSRLFGSKSRAAHIAGVVVALLMFVPTVVEVVEYPMSNGQKISKLSIAAGQMIGTIAALALSPELITGTRRD